MEITTKNFIEKLPEIKATIKEADFFAIDSEFTGISDKNIYPFDSPEDVYLKTTNSISDYIIIQIGLCAFRLQDDKILCKTFNFYIFPGSRINVFTSQGESLKFLAENGFDFNKLFRYGLNYVNTADEEKLRLDLKEKQKYRANLVNSKEENSNEHQIQLANHIPIPEEEQELINGIRERIDNFIKSDEKQFIVENCNGFQRKLVYQILENYQNEISHSSYTDENNKSKGILIEHKRSAEDEQVLEEERIKKEEEQLLLTIGFSLVLQDLSKSKKLIIGHNMLLDVLYLIKQFFKPLPSNYEEFKKFLHKTFPYLIDTKYFCTTHLQLKPQFNSTVLQHIFRTVSKAPFNLPKIESESMEYEYSTDQPKEHEAGYDAYLTGICFLSLMDFIKVNVKEIKQTSKMNKIVNRIFLGRVNDVNYIDISNKEPSVKKDHVFYITFPETWKQSDIFEKFKKYGFIHITWINSWSAFIMLHNRLNALAVIKTIGHTPGFTITTFEQYKQKQQNYRYVSDKRIFTSPNNSKSIIGVSKPIESSPGSKCGTGSSNREETSETHKKEESQKRSSSFIASSKTNNDDEAECTNNKKTKLFHDNDNW
uniref:Poly(A)-specific ribonuclease PARN n=1 Tax=Corethrella appendiculata TaxID=1370023 RepID=U5ES41_9DIPT